MMGKRTFALLAAGGSSLSSAPMSRPFLGQHRGTSLSRTGPRQAGGGGCLGRLPPPLSTTVALTSKPHYVFPSKKGSRGLGREAAGRRDNSGDVCVTIDFHMSLTDLAAPLT
jgi:hypothetical protein